MYHSHVLYCIMYISISTVVKQSFTPSVVGSLYDIESEIYAGWGWLGHLEFMNSLDGKLL